MNSEEMITGNESDMQRDGESAAENPAAYNFHRQSVSPAGIQSVSDRDP